MGRLRSTARPSPIAMLIGLDDAPSVERQVEGEHQRREGEDGEDDDPRREEEVRRALPPDPPPEVADPRVPDVAPRRLTCGDGGHVPGQLRARMASPCCAALS